jgi:hypothetical protein
MDEMSKNRTGLIRSILVLTICIISCTIFLANHKAQIKLEGNNEETEFLDPTSTNAIEEMDQNTVDRSTITLESVNDMFRVASEVFTDEDNLRTLSIQKVTVLGYLPGNPSEKLGRIEGIFTCKDDTGECVLANEIKKLNNGTYQFAMPAVFTLNKNNNYYISLLNDDQMSRESSFRLDYKVIE